MSNVSRHMEPTVHTPILRRTGSVLLAVGLLDIAVMIYCIVNRLSYSSSFNIFAVIAGIFLLRGSLRAAIVVRWLSVFMLAGFVALLFAWPFMQPMNLTLTQIRLNPYSALMAVVLMLGVFALLYWLQRQLGKAPILIARASAGRKTRDMRIPAAAGVAIVTLLSITLGFLLGGESAGKAMSIAEQKLGPNYRYHVSSLNIAKTSQGTFIAGVVTAWNDQQVQNVPVEWKE
jgi:hypothetical protein